MQWDGNLMPFESESRRIQAMPTKHSSAEQRRQATGVNFREGKFLDALA
jgi:hypothetical protein